MRKSNVLIFCMLAVFCTGLLPPMGFAVDASTVDTLVVVNSKSRDSRQLGTYYAKQRQIPKEHICRISVDPKSRHISVADFETEVNMVIHQFMADNQLTPQIRNIVLSMDIPTCVGRDNSITGALYYGYKPRTPGNTAQCDVAPDSVNGIFMAEAATPASSRATRFRPMVFMLAVADLEEGKALIDRSVAADSTFPEGAFHLHGSSDVARNVRAARYPVVERAFAEFADVLPPIVIAMSNAPQPEVPVLGYLAGVARVPDRLAQADFAPGAIADHLTSCGGILPDACGGQSTFWDWFRLGAIASYGTVTEPCNILGKFPDPMMMFLYARGFTAGEAYWMSVRNPYQGLFAGDPLCAPFAAPPQIEIPGPKSGATIQRGDELTIRLSTHSNGVPPVYLDLYVDGKHAFPIFQPQSPEGNILFVEIGPRRFTYRITAGEDVSSAVASLAWSITQESAEQIRAVSVADRLEVRVAKPTDFATGQPLPFRVGTEEGVAEGLYIGARAGRNDLSVKSGIGYAGATFHLGTTDSFEFDYPLDYLLDLGLVPGKHTLTLVVRDGSALESRSSLDWHFTIPK